jgi:hypothetical protein
MSDNLMENILHSRIDWESSTESPYTFQAVCEGRAVRLRLNDFPDEPLCTLIVEGTETDLREFPPLWTLPRHRERGTSP